MNTLEVYTAQSWPELMVNCTRTQDYLLKSVLDLKYSLERKRNHTLIRSMSGRLKSKDSIKAKLVRNEWEVTPQCASQKLHDIAGIRIICSYLQDVRDVLDELYAIDHLTILEIKDYITRPKPSGYRSLHVVGLCDISGKNTLCEIQLRTTAMDSWASLEHEMRYKKDLPQSDYVNKGLLDVSALLFESDCRMEQLHLYLKERRDPNQS